MKCIEEEIPFELPQGWEWSRFSSAFIINPRNNLPDDTEVSFIPMSLIQEGYANNHTFEKKMWGNVKSGFTHFAENDIGVAKITPCFENKKSVVFRNLTSGFGAGTTELHIIRSINDSIYPEYVLWNIKTDGFISNGVNAFSGAVGQKRISKDFVEKYLIPIAPTLEQKRIVERISTAFKCIDEIDISKEAFKLDIDIVKSKILDLAIRGKLVPQDQNDEPASVLLERIRAEKEELIKQGKIKRDKKESVIFKGEDNSYYENLPANWSITTLGTISALITKGTTPRGGNVAYLDSGIGFLRAENISGYDKLNLQNLKCIDDDTHNNYLKRSILQGDDILITIAGTLGRTAVVTEDALPLNANQAIAIVRLVSNRLVCNRYVTYALNSSDIQKSLLRQEVAMAIPNLSLENISNCSIPIPPIKEQYAIVALIDNMFATIDNIEESLK